MQLWNTLITEIKTLKEYTLKHMLFQKKCESGSLTEKLIKAPYGCLNSHLAYIQDV